MKIGNPFGRKHRCYRYASNWYSECATCARVLWAQKWAGAFGLLELHVREHV